MTADPTPTTASGAPSATGRPHAVVGATGQQGGVTARALLAAGLPVRALTRDPSGGAERHTGIPHFDSRRAVEEHLAGLGLPVTFVRPTFFVENLAWMAPQEQDGELVQRMLLPSGVPLQMVAVDDIGRVAAAAPTDPSAVPGDAVEIAGDEDQQRMWTWFAGTPAYEADLDLTKSLDPQVVDLRTWVGQHA